MGRFLVFLPGGSQAINTLFPENYMIDADRLWAVASDDPTPLDVSTKLGIGGNQVGVVVRFEGFYGNFNTGLWQKLDQWAGMP